MADDEHQERASFACPSCGQRVGLDPKFIGLRLACPHCGTVVTVSAPLPASPTARTGAVPVAPEGPGRSQAPPLPPPARAGAMSPGPKGAGAPGASAPASRREATSSYQRAIPYAVLGLAVLLLLLLLVLLFLRDGGGGTSGWLVGEGGGRGAGGGAVSPGSGGGGGAAAGASANEDAEGEAEGGEDAEADGPTLLVHAHHEGEPITSGEENSGGSGGGFLIGGEPGGGGGQGTTNFFGIADDGSNFVYVVDRSGSMHGPKLEQLKEELVSSIYKLKRSHRFFVIFYDDTELPMPGGMAEADDGSKKRARNWIADVPNGGGTVPAEALRMAIEMKPDAIFFMTDGIIPPDTPEVVRQANPRKNVRIHTVGFGSMADAPVLQTIAEENNGVFRHVEVKGDPLRGRPRLPRSLFR